MCKCGSYSYYYKNKYNFYNYYNINFNTGIRYCGDYLGIYLQIIINIIPMNA